MMMTTDTRAEEETRTARGDGGHPWDPTGIPQRSRHAAGGRESAHDDGTRTDERDAAGGGRRVDRTGRGHPPGTAEPPPDGTRSRATHRAY